MFRRVLGLLAGLIAIAPAAAQTARPVEILAASAMAGALHGLEPSLRAHGLAPVFSFGTAGIVHDRVVAGVSADVVIALPAQIDDLVRREMVVAGSKLPLARALLGAAVRAGAPIPDISTADAARRSFLAAESLGFADPATGATTGIYFARLLREQGMEQALDGRVHLFPDGTQAMEAVARGDIALAAGQLSEIKPVAGVRLVGQLPQAWQLATIYEGAITRQAAHSAAAKLVMHILADKSAAPVLARSGLERP